MINHDNFKALAILMLIILLASCRPETVITEEQLNHRLDSVFFLMRMQDTEIAHIKARKSIRDTIIVENHKKVNNEINTINRFNAISRRRFADSVNRANNLN